MSKSKNSNLTTISVALVLSLVCAVMVSAVAVGLKPQQIENARLDRNKNILMAADMFNPRTDNSSDVQSRFEDFEVKLVDIEKGKYADEADLKAADITDVNAYDPDAARRKKNMSIALGEEDIAGIGSIAKYAKIYVKSDAQGEPELVVLPVYGYGLWGTMYGFLTLENDLNTIKGISFYEHKETPGLGARIDEPQWRAQFEGKESYDEQGNVATGVTKAGNHKDNWVDGISGATLTSRGVSNMLQFWLGDYGYKPFLDNLREGNAGEPASNQDEVSQPEQVQLSTPAQPNATPSVSGKEA